MKATQMLTINLIISNSVSTQLHLLIPSFSQPKQSMRPRYPMPATTDSTRFISTYCTKQEYNRLTLADTESPADTLVGTGTKGLAVVLVVPPPLADCVEAIPGIKNPILVLLDSVKPATFEIEVAIEFVLVVVSLDFERVVVGVEEVSTTSRDDVVDGITDIVSVLQQSYRSLNA